MRELKYAVEGKAANLRTFAVDEPGHGGACHCYLIELTEHLRKKPTIAEIDAILDRGDEVEINGGGGAAISHGVKIYFQNGPINADGNGVNGVQHEDLLAILIDRLEGFQRGPYECLQNAVALDQCRTALIVLQQRTRDRIARNVEGTHTV